MTVQEKALRYLYREQRNAKQAYSQAEYRTGVMQDELDNLTEKLEALDYCITLVLAATHETPLPVEFLKRALVEVRDICRNNFSCHDCPFGDGKRRKKAYYCPIKWVSTDANELYMPEDWQIDDWKEDGKDAKD